MNSARERLASTSLDYYPLSRLADAGVGDPSRLPVTIKILLEGLLRGVERGQASDVSLRALTRWPEPAPAGAEVPYLPSRILLQDFTGVPAVVDLAAMRSAMQRAGKDAGRIDPMVQVDLVIDHSVQVDAFGSLGAYARNIEREYARNGVSQLHSGATRHGYLPPGQPRAIEPGGSDRQGCEGQLRDSRHAAGHRLAHHHGQRPGGAGLGRRWDRGGSRAAGATHLPADAGGDRRPDDGCLAAGRNGDRSRADLDGNAPQARGGQQIRGILWRRALQPFGARPRHPFEHVPRVRRHLIPLPRGPADPPLPRDHRPRPSADRAGTALHPGAGYVPQRRVGDASLQRAARARPQQRRAQRRRPEATPGPGAAASGLAELHLRLRGG